jgi:hypothetical protein
VPATAQTTGTTTGTAETAEAAERPAPKESIKQLRGSSRGNWAGAEISDFLDVGDGEDVGDGARGAHASQDRQPLRRCPKTKTKVTAKPTRPWPAETSPKTANPIHARACAVGAQPLLNAPHLLRRYGSKRFASNAAYFPNLHWHCLVAKLLKRTSLL